MVSFAERAMAYNVLNAPIRPYPYPHIYVPEVFPPEYYAEMQRNMPRHEAMAPIGEVRPVSGYNERFVLQLLGPMDGLTAPQAAFWDDFGRWLLSGRFRDLLLMKFRAQVSHRFQGIADVQFRDEAMLVEDQTNYALGPHTDTPAKVVTVLFYLPPDASRAHLGTSIYVPKDPTFRCPGTAHHDRDGFDRVATMPFTPNSLFAFVKTNQTFHGVESVEDPDPRRWLLLYDIKMVQAPKVEGGPG